MPCATAKLFVTSCPTNGLWFEFFIGGLHSRWEMITGQILSFVLKKMLKYAEAKWHRSVDIIERPCIVQAVSSIGILGSFAGRGWLERILLA